MSYFKPEMVPGMRRDGSQYEAMNTWFDGNNVRFKLDRPESVGGWEEIALKDFSGVNRDLKGVARSIFQWIAGNNQSYMLIGTTWKLYITYGGNVYDITPLKDDNYDKTGAGVKSADYSFPGFDSGTDFTTISVRKDSNFLRIETIIGGTPLANSENTFVMIKDLTGFTSTGGITPAMLNSGYDPASGSVEDDGWQLFIEDDDYFIKINNLVDDLSDYDSTLRVELTDPAAVIVHTQESVSVSNQMEVGDIIKIDNEYIKLGGTRTNPGSGINFTYDGCTRGVRGSTADTHLISRPITMYEKKVTISGGKIWYSIDTGVDADIEAQSAFGWSSGDWSEGTWGTPDVGVATLSTSLRYWNIYSNGDDVVCCPTHGDIFYISLSDITVSGNVPDISDVNSRRAVKLANYGDLKGITPVKIPVRSGSILMTTLSGHLISFGSEHYSGTTTTSYSPILVRWSDNDLNDKYIFDWGLRSTNTAGGYVLNSGSKIAGIVESDREILIWTDISMYSMKYAGPPTVFSLKLISSNVSLMSKHAAVVVGNSVYFMGTENFYIYKGQLSRLLCTVSNHIFDDINRTQLCKVYATVNERFSEITWFYPSKESYEVNRYAIYNYLDKTWVTGYFDMSLVNTVDSFPDVSGNRLARNRTAWLDASIEDNPISAFIKTFDYKARPTDVTSGILKHEEGYSRTYLDDGSLPLNSFIESGDIDIDGGNGVFFLRKFYPDIYWTGSAPIMPEDGVDFEFSSKKYPSSFPTVLNTPTSMLVIQAVSVASIAITKGDGVKFPIGTFISVLMNDGSTHSTTVKAVTSTAPLFDTITLNDALPGTASVGATVTGVTTRVSVNTVKVFEPTEETSNASSTNPVPSDGKYDLRGRGKTFSVKLTSDTVNYGWRLGDFLVDVRPDGKRY